MVGVVVLAFAETVPMAIVATTLMGVSGVTWPAFNAMVAAIVQGPLRQQYFGVNFALVNLGIGLGGVVSGFYVDVSRPETFTTIYLVRRRVAAHPGRAAARAAAPRARPRRQARRRPPACRPPTSRSLRQPAMAWLLLLTFIAMFVGYGQMEAGFPAFAREASEVSTRTIGWAFAANTAVIVLGPVPGAAPHRGPPAHASADGDEPGVGAGLDRARPAPPSSPATLVAAFGVVLFHVLFGFGETMLQPTVPAMTNDLAPDHLRGRYNALSSGSSSSAASPARSSRASCCGTTRRRRSS